MMPRFLNRTEFVQYILRKLGGGVNRIQITPDQIDDCIDDAVRKFQRYHYQGSGRAVLVIPKQSNRQQTFTLPSTTLAVNEVLHGRYSYYNVGTAPDGGQSTAATEEYLLYGRRPSYASTGNADGQVITPYYIQEQFYNTLLDSLIPEPQYRYSHVTKELHLLSPIDRRDYFNNTTALYLEVETEYTEDSYPDMYDHEWLREYCVALCGVQWGENITRFTNVALPGQGVSNGDAILERYQAKLDKLEVELKSTGQVPKIFVM